MEKIDFSIINNINDIEFNQYHIMPYYSPESIVYIEMSKDEIKWYNNSLKSISGYKKIENNLKKMYRNSNFYGYNITILGFLLKEKYKNSLMVFDLLLNEEISKRLQSKKYSIRFDNIRNRFVNKAKSKLVLSVFSQKNNLEELDKVTMMMIESNSWDGLIFYKDKPYNYDVDGKSMLFYKAWDIAEGKIIDCEYNFDENNKSYISSILVYSDNLKNNFKICGNLAEIQKIYNSNINDLINKEILFKYCIIKSDKDVSALTNFLKFK